MSQNPAFNKLIRLLKKLFQLDQPDLDFGLYRIMHARADEISKFLDQDLLPQVKEAFSQYKTADKAELEKELQQAIEQAKGLGVDPESTAKVKELRQTIAEQGVDVTGLEQEVYDHLYKFFRRYYHEGDFLAKRVYKPGVYAIPYEGEEVKLHWANKDQYYIKTSEYLRDYAFTLKPDADGPMRVHFRLVDAAEGEHGNVKEAEGKNRVFILAGEDFIAEENGESGKELVIRFEYRPARMDDWPENIETSKKRSPGKPTKKELEKPPAQDHLKAFATERIFSVAESDFEPWLAELSKNHVKADGEQADYSRLAAHLNRYTARNTFDYFIHKNLGGFLRRELDFYIKNEVMHLDDIESETAPRVEQYLSKIKVIRQIAGKIIDFLAQLENFQKKLWLKKKFVTETNYCITLDRIPEDFYGEIADNNAQRAEWDLLGLDYSRDRYMQPGSDAHLIVDTKHFDDEFKSRILESIPNLADTVSGHFVISDNFQALRLCQKRFREKIQLCYIDPPYNTGDDLGFAYKDNYQSSSWLAMMNDRLSLSNSLLSKDGTLYAQIDYSEKERLKLLLDEKFKYITEIIWRIGWLSGYKTKASKFIRNHDTIYQYGMSERPKFNKQYIPYPSDYVRRDGKRPEGEGYPLEDTWNCSELDKLNSIQIVSFSKEKVGDDALTQKNEDLLERMITSSSDPGDWVLDFFLGSGTTAATAIKLCRRWLGAEAVQRAINASLPRLKRVLTGDSYGISKRVGWGGGGGFSYCYLESYEDALNNLAPARSKAQEDLLTTAAAQEANGLREDYLLRYMLDVETRGSQSLLNIDAFIDPTAYKLKVKQPGGEETREVNVDLLETFNWLIGLTVETIVAPKTVTAQTKPDDDPDLPKENPRRLLLDGRIREADDGPWWFRTVTGTTPDGRKTLVIWRKLTGEPEQDNLVLDEWFKKQGYSSKDSEFDLIYVNGDNNLENLRQPDDTWKVRLIEEDFHRLMFEEAEA